MTAEDTTSRTDIPVLGVAQLEPDGAQSLEDLMANADAAMYENKRRKKNRVQT